MEIYRSLIRAREYSLAQSFKHIVKQNSVTSNFNGLDAAFKALVSSQEWISFIGREKVDSLKQNIESLKYFLDLENGSKLDKELLKLIEDAKEQYRLEVKKFKSWSREYGKNLANLRTQLKVIIRNLPDAESVKPIQTRGHYGSH